MVMSMHDKVSERILNDDRVQSVLNYKDSKNLLVTGVNDDFKPVFLKELTEQSKRPNVIFVENNHHMEKLANSMMDIMDDVYTFPVGDIMIESLSKQSPEFMKSRMSTLSALLHERAGLFIVPIHGLLKPLMPKEKLASYEKTLEVGSIINYDDFLEFLVSLGYKRVSQADNFGEFAVRGDIIDIYMHDTFLRIELFDDEVDSLRLLDPETQRSLENIKEASIEPYAEYIVEPSERLELLEKIEQLYEETSSGLSEVNKTALEDYYNTVTHPDLLSDYIGQFAHLLDNHNQSLLDYLGPNHRVFADDITAIKSAYDAEFEAVHNYFSSVLEAGQMFKGGANYLEGHLSQSIYEVYASIDW